MTYLKTPGFVPVTEKETTDTPRASIDRNIGSIKSTENVQRGQGTFTPLSGNTSTGLSLQQSAYNSGQRSRDLLKAQTNEKAKFINDISEERGKEFYAGGQYNGVGTVTNRQRRADSIDNGTGDPLVDYTKRGGNVTGGFTTEKAAGTGARIDTGAFATSATRNLQQQSDNLSAQEAQARKAQQESERKRLTANIDFASEIKLNQDRLAELDKMFLENASANDPTGRSYSGEAATTEYKQIQDNIDRLNKGLPAVVYGTTKAPTRSGTIATATDPLDEAVPFEQTEEYQRIKQEITNNMSELNAATFNRNLQKKENRGLGMSDVESDLFDTEEKQRAEDDARIEERRRLDEEQKQTMQEEHDSLKAEQELKVKQEKERQKKQIDERTEKARALLAADGRLTTDNEGNLTPDAIALLDEITRKGDEDLNDQYRILDDTLKTNLRSLQSQLDSNMFKVDQASNEFEDGIIEASRARKDAYDMLDYKASLETSDADKARIIQAGSKVYRYDPGTDSLIELAGGEEEDGDLLEQRVSSFNSLPSSETQAVLRMLKKVFPGSISNEERQIMSGEYVKHKEEGGDLSSFRKLATGFDPIPDGDIEKTAIQEYIYGKSLGRIDPADNQDINELIKLGLFGQAFGLMETLLTETVEKDFNSDITLRTAEDQVAELSSLVSAPGAAELLGFIDGTESGFRLKTGIGDSEKRKRAQLLAAKMTTAVQEMRKKLLGSAITPSEEAFLAPIMPELTDQPDQILIKSASMLDSILDKHNAVRSIVRLPRITAQQITNEDREAMYLKKAIKTPPQTPTPETTTQKEQETTTDTQKDFRTDRHNNPTAFTTEIAVQSGLIEGVDYEQGDAFPNDPNSFTAKLLKDPIETTIKVIDNVGFFTEAGQPRWTHTTHITNDMWQAMSLEQKKVVLQKMYKNEGGGGIFNFNQ